jgi:hypothetical protein
MCRHNFKEISRVFTPPVDSSNGWKMRGLDEDLALRILYGFTALIFFCDKCGRAKSTTEYGDHTVVGP